MDEHETFLEADERIRYEATTHGHCLTITAAHRECLRDIERGDLPADKLYLVRELLAVGLLDEPIMGRVRLTADGRALLAAHDRLAETRRVERPRLEPRLTARRNRSSA